MSVNALSGLYLISTCYLSINELKLWDSVSMPSRAYTSFLPGDPDDGPHYHPEGVNALSGLYLISTKQKTFPSCLNYTCVNALSGLYLISTMTVELSCLGWKRKRVNALSGLYLISTFPDWEGYSLDVPVSMPSRAYTSFLRCPFKNLGFIRFPEPVFAGIYQNILTTAVFRAC